MNASIRVEALLAFAFGCVFCTILAYAGLRNVPVSDPGQFYLLRVLAALSSAGVAAVIPGMLDVKLKTGSLVLIRATGAIAVFVIVFYSNPPKLLSEKLETKVQSMYSNYGQGFYDAADRVADDILRRYPDEARALNIKGGVAFYSRRYQDAVEYFTKCTKVDPKIRDYWSNLADAMVEIGALHKAIEIYLQIRDGKADSYLGIGRAYVYNREYKSALSELEIVPDTHSRGAARFFEAAALLGSASLATEIEGHDLREKASRKLQLLLSLDRKYWEEILSGQVANIHMPLSLPSDLLLEITHAAVAATQSSKAVAVAD